MSEIMSISSDSHLVLNGRLAVQQASKRIALESVRFMEKSEALNAAYSVGLDDSSVRFKPLSSAKNSEGMYQLEIDIPAEILRIKSAQHQVKIGMQLHAIETDLNNDIKELLR